MNVQLEKLEHNMALLTIEVAAEDFEDAVERAYKKNKNKINMPGFRRGKVSRMVIGKMYGKDFFYGDAANIIIPEEWEKAYDECEEEIVSSPEIDVVTLEVGKPFVFTAKVALNPKATLKKYKGLQVEKFDTEVTDEDVVAAYRFKGAESLQEALKPVNNTENDYTLSQSNSFVTWSAGDGFFIPAIQGAGLINTLLQQNMVGTVAVKFGNGDTGDKMIGLVMQNSYYQLPPK